MPGWVRRGINGSTEPFGKLKALSLSRARRSPLPYARTLESWPPRTLFLVIYILNLEEQKIDY